MICDSRKSALCFGWFFLNKLQFNTFLYVMLVDLVNFKLGMEGANNSFKLNNSLLFYPLVDADLYKKANTTIPQGSWQNQFEIISSSYRSALNGKSQNIMINLKILARYFVILVINNVSLHTMQNLQQTTTPFKCNELLFLANSAYFK